jgi:hypothetical protein
VSGSVALQGQQREREHGQAELDEVVPIPVISTARVLRARENPQESSIA